VLSDEPELPPELPEEPPEEGGEYGKVVEVVNPQNANAHPFPCIQHIPLASQQSASEPAVQDDGQISSFIEVHEPGF